jgi:hypothetical protein
MRQVHRIGRVFRALVPFRRSRSSHKGDRQPGAQGRQAVKIRIPVIAVGEGRQGHPVLVPVQVRRNR